MATGVGIEQGSGVAPSDDAAALSGSALSQQAVSAVPATGANAFTPGPWYTTGREDMLRIREESSDYIIATTDDGGHPEIEVFDYATQEANARLIAASPTMLAFVARKAAEGDAEAASIVEAINASR